MNSAFAGRWATVVALGVILPAWGQQPPQGPQPKKPLVDLYGDPLPEGALMRLGAVRFRHGAAVTCVAWSPDGKTLASASDDNTIRLRDSVSGNEMRSCSGHQASVLCVAWSPDGK